MIHFLKTIVSELTTTGTFHNFKNKYLSENKFFCPVCNNYLSEFYPLPHYYLKKWDQHEFIHSIFTLETFNFLAFLCPVCGASDRDRLYALYIQDRLNTMDHSRVYSFLEFAPSQSLSKKIKSFSFINYRSVDLLMEDVDDIADITNMSDYKDNSFDMFLCSHVLEHVDDDRKAVKELFRILRPRGWGILMVPINLALEHTYEDNSIITEADRWKHFGQNDHVRIYAKNDYINLLKDSGFKVLQLGMNYFGRDTFNKHGIHKRSALYIVEK